MIAVDTNILVYAHRRDAPYHQAAFARITELAEQANPWAIPWPCLHEFVGIVTHPRVYNPPSRLEQAIDQVAAWLESPSLVTIGESDRYWSILTAVAVAGRVTGPRVHDARIAALCRLHQVTALWSLDRDFSRFPDLRVINPLLR